MSCLGTVLSSGLTGQALQNGTRWTFIVAGIASLALAAFSLVLPHTPPRKIQAGENRFAWLEAGKLLRHPFVLVLWIVTFVDAFFLGYFAGPAFSEPRSNPAAWASPG